MPTNPRGILAIWHDIDPKSIEDFGQWHSRQHMPERLSVPGFLTGVRYEAVDSSPLVFNYYLTESPATLSSPAYLERLNNPSEWSARVIPALRDVYRAAGREVTSLGAGQGGAIGTLRFNTLSDRSQPFQAWFTEHGMNELAALPGINKIHLWQTDTSTSGIKTEESSRRGGTAQVRDWTVAIEGSGIQPVRTASAHLQQQPAFAATLQDKALVGCYRLVHRLDC